jgi:hypothetical protein
LCLVVMVAMCSKKKPKEEVNLLLMASTTADFGELSSPPLCICLRPLPSWRWSGLRILFGEDSRDHR